jgi:tetratricopeptide (TPR) repeat protein
MVREDGEPLLMDFGLAARADETEKLTVAGQFMGTPEYTAPEQWRGEAGPASDQYALGCVLFELLTGRVPFRGGSSEHYLMLHTQQAPPALRALRPELPRDLETMCHKCLEKLPAQRYDDCQALADDLRRWLEGEPIAVRRVGPIERLARWGRKNPATAGLIGAVAVLLLTGTVVAWSLAAWALAEKGRAKDQEKDALVQKNQANEQRDRAEKNFEAVRQLGLRLIKISEEKVSALGRSEPARAALLEATLTTLVPLLAARPDDPRLQEHVALVHRYSANVHRLLGDNASAERSYNESIRLWMALFDSEGATRYHRIQLAETLRDSANLSSRLGKLGVAAERLHRSVKIAEGVTGSVPGEKDPRSLLALTLVDLAEVEQMRGRFEQAEQVSHRAVELYRALLAGPPSARGQFDQLFLAMALMSRGTCQRLLRHVDESLDSHAEAVNEMRKVRKQIPADDVLHFLGLALVEQALTLAKIPARHREAETALDEAIENWQAMRIRSPQRLLFSEWQAIAYRARGELRTEMKNLDPAADDLGQSRTILEGLVKQASALPGYRAHLGRTYGAMGRLALARKNANNATAWFDKAITTLGRALEQDQENAITRGARDEYQAEARRLKR